MLLTTAHFHTLDVGATHAATAINEKQQLPGGFVHFQRFTQQVGAEI